MVGHDVRYRTIISRDEAENVLVGEGSNRRSFQLAYQANDPEQTCTHT